MQAQSLRYALDHAFCSYMCIYQRWVRLARIANRLELELATEIC